MNLRVIRHNLASYSAILKFLGAIQFSKTLPDTFLILFAEENRHYSDFPRGHLSLELAS